MAKQTIGYKYFMGIHMGLGRGPVDEIVEIRVGDRTAWTGAVIENTSFQINVPELFGGEKSEGGVQGSLSVHMGAPDQPLPSWAGRLGGLVPAFRGVTTLFYDGLIATNNPYPKPWKVRVRRAKKGWDRPVWYPETARVLLAGGAIHAMNPAHILYEAATDRVWGRGADPARLDLASFADAADTHYAEGLGLCFKYSRKAQDVKAFMQDVADHAGGDLYVDRATGLLTYKLVRGGYDRESLPLFTYGSGLIAIDEDKTGSEDSSVNEVVVHYHDPITDSKRSKRVQNLAAWQADGSVISVERQYAGIPTAGLAVQIAQRELEASGSGLRRYKLRLDRRAWRLAPGMPFRVSAPDRGIDDLVLRCGLFNDGTPASGEISVTALQDVFGLPAQSFITPQQPEWTPPDRTPQVAGARRVIEEDYRSLARRLSDADLATVDGASCSLLALARAPTSLSLDFAIASRAEGEAAAVVRGTGDWSPTATLTSAIGHYDTSLSVENASSLSRVVPGTAAVIGAEGGAGEIVRVDAIDLTLGTVTVARGCVDTIPALHPAGTRIWFHDDFADSDNREYLIGETAHVQMLTRTSIGQVEMDVAPVDTLTLVGRQGRPYPAGDWRIGGAPFADVEDLSGDTALTWAHRNRLLQDDQLVPHATPSVGPEAGVTYTLRVFDGETMKREAAALVEPTFLYTGAMATEDTGGAAKALMFELETWRGADKALSTYRHSLLVTPPAA